MLTWARETLSTWVTPGVCRMRRTIRSLSGCWRKISMSALWRGAWNGPGRSTACSGSAGVADDAGAVGSLGAIEECCAGGVVGEVAVGPDEPSPHPASSRADNMAQGT